LIVSTASELIRTTKETTRTMTTDNRKLLLREFNRFEIEDDEGKAEGSEGHDFSKLRDDQPLVLTGVIQRANTLNANGRVYPFDVLKQEIVNYQKLIKENRAYGELDHAEEPIVNMKNVSHMITKIWMEGDNVKAKVRVFDTPSGKIIREIVKGGGVPGISSRALGSLKKQGDVNYVQDDLQIICWDFVSEPSTPGAFMKLAESKLYDPKEVFTKNDLIFRALNNTLSIAEQIGGMTTRKGNGRNK
jgi:hypothetical protein